MDTSEKRFEFEIEQYLISHGYEQFNGQAEDCFWCQLVSGNLDLLEATDARWLTKSSLRTVVWLPADLSLIAKIENTLL